MISVRRALRALVRLSPLEAYFLVKVACLFVLAELAVRVTSLDRAAGLFGVRLAFDDAPVMPLPSEPIPLTEAERLSMRSVSRISPRVYGPTRGCLRRSLVVGRVLRRLEPVMRLGAQRREEALVVHAWVDINGFRLDAEPDLMPFRSA
jgi:hypothetical protein